MKEKLLSLLLSSLIITASAFAERGEVGPRGGKLLDNSLPRAELLVLSDRRISIIFVDQEKKHIPPYRQEISAKVAVKGKTIDLKLSKKDEEFISSEALPEGDGHLVIVQIKQSPADKSQNFRVKYESHICGGCNHAEYACTCDE